LPSGGLWAHGTREGRRHVTTKPWQRMSANRYKREVARAMDEDTFQAIVVSDAKRLGWRVYHTFDSRHSAAGFPDLCMVRPPRVVFVELKRVGAKLTQPQLEWQSDLRACHGNVECHIWRPDDDYMPVLR
jgi:hypothetical protein